MLFRSQPIEKQYLAVLNGQNLAVQKSVDAHLKTLHQELITANPQAFHLWMQKWVYDGSAMQGMFRWEMLGSFATFLVLVGLGLWWDLNRRKHARDGEHIRGTELLSWREFNREVLSAKGATPGVSFTVGALGQKATIPRELEPYHFNIFGSTGMGKSTLIRELLYQIESRGDVAVVYDTKGEYRDEFFSENRGDIILDPGDQRCPYWAIEAEAQDEAQATPWAMAFWPDEPRQQPFFKKHPAKHAEMLIGHHEVERIQENRPVHLLARHRSRSWNNQTVDTPVVSAAEIQGLPRFMGYLLQEGKVVRIKIQKLPQRVRTERLSRLIPPVIFREPPERDLAGGESIVPVDDDAQLIPVPAAAHDVPVNPCTAQPRSINALDRRGRGGFNSQESTEVI